MSISCHNGRGTSWKQRQNFGRKFSRAILFAKTRTTDTHDRPDVLKTVFISESDIVFPNDVQRRRGTSFPQMGNGDASLTS